MPKWRQARSRPAAGALALICAVALAAFAGCAEDPGASGSAAEEIDWLERLSRWEDRTDEAAEEAFNTYSAVLAGEQRPEWLFEALRPIRRCSERLRDDVGEPPGRFADGYELMLRACRSYARYAAEVERAFNGDAGAALAASEAAGAEADGLVLEARRAIEQRLTTSRELPRLGGDTDRSRVEPLFSRVASAVVGRRVEVVCWSRDDWPQARREWGTYIGRTDIGAFAHYGADRAYLSPEYCEGLVDLAYRDRRPHGGDARDKIADGIATLGHESEHLVAAVAGEEETECYGMQDMRRIARLLGASPDYAGELAELYWEELYETLPDGYTSPECRDGGPWDRNDASSVWP